MKIIRIVLFILIIIGIVLLVSQSLWLPRVTSFFMQSEKTPEIITITPQATSTKDTAIASTTTATSSTSAEVILGAKAGEHCGGNMKDARSCVAGYHCAPAAGSHLPFGDVGGICVSD